MRSRVDLPRFKWTKLLLHCICTVILTDFPCVLVFVMFASGDILLLEKIAEKHRKLYLAEAVHSTGDTKPESSVDSDNCFEELCRSEQSPDAHQLIQEHSASGFPC